MSEVLDNAPEPIDCECGKKMVLHVKSIEALADDPYVNTEWKCECGKMTDGPKIRMLITDYTSTVEVER